MNIISLLDNFINSFNNKFNVKFNLMYLEEKIKNIGDDFTINLYKNFLEGIDLEFKNSTERKLNYTVKDTVERSILTSIGYITFNQTIYKNKLTNKCFYFLRDEILNMKPYQRMTDYAEYTLTKYAMSENMAQAARHALRNIVVSRSCVSKKLSKLDGTIYEEINKADFQPDILYIEMDEIHANLQDKRTNDKSKNHVCPCAIVHEGHKEEFTKRKELKNIRNFASSNLNYRQLWDVIFDYVDKKYDITKFKKIFVSGDGASGIKSFSEVLPNAIYVYDKYHYYYKDLQYIFKDDKNLSNLADEYIRNRYIEGFKELVKYQIKLYPESKKYIIQKQNTIINNIDGIINQQDKDYKCPCSMESHVSNSYARYITSIPFAFSKTGLENKLKLLVLNANHHELTLDEFYHLKYYKNEYNKIINDMKKITDININHLNNIDDYNTYPIDFIRSLDNQINYKLKNIIRTNTAKFIEN